MLKLPLYALSGPTPPFVIATLLEVDNGLVPDHCALMLTKTAEAKRLVKISFFIVIYYLFFCLLFEGFSA